MKPALIHLGQAHRAAGDGGGATRRLVNEPQLADDVHRAFEQDEHGIAPFSFTKQRVARSGKDEFLLPGK